MNAKFGTLFALILITTSFKSMNHPHNNGCYHPNYVEISIVKYNDEQFHVVAMKRDGDRVKAKYFAARDYNGDSVYKRFTNWKKNNPNIILISSGTYFGSDGNLQGLTIDNGRVVNQSLIYDKMDALVIVYATGGIAVSNLKEGNINVSGINRSLNLRKSGYDLDDFIEWAKKEEATVFQTHLLAYKDQLTIDPYKSSPDLRERRFLAAGKDENGGIIHAIVHSPTYSTLYNGSKRTLKFLNEAKDMEVVFMINLDPGAQDVFELYNSDCTVNKTIGGLVAPANAVNILTYYFK